MTEIVQSEVSGPGLSFIVEHRREEFVKYVLKLYTHSAQYINTKGISDIPDINQDIAHLLGDIWLESAMVQETGNSDALQEYLNELGEDEDPLERLEDLHEDFNHPAYSHLREQYIQDIASVCNFYHLSHRITFTFSPLERTVYYELHNHAVVSVW